MVGSTGPGSTGPSPGAVATAASYTMPLLVLSGLPTNVPRPSKSGKSGSSLLQQHSERLALVDGSISLVVLARPWLNTPQPQVVAMSSSPSRKLYMRMTPLMNVTRWTGESFARTSPSLSILVSRLFGWRHIRKG